MRVSLYAIENGFYLIPTIELMWDGPERLGVCFVWLNRDITIWLKHERERKDNKNHIDIPTTHSFLITSTIPLLRITRKIWFAAEPVLSPRC